MATIWALGAFAELGFEFRFDESMRIITSISYDAASLRPKSSELVSYKENGEDLTSQLLTYQRETEYLDEYNLAQSPYYRTFPEKSRKVKYGFSAISINFGLRMDLN